MSPHDIFENNIAIKRQFDKKNFFSSKNCTDVSKYFQTTVSIEHQ